MKTFWNVVSFLAIVHLFAVVMFVAWLWQSNRLSGERVEQARQIFAPTIPEAVAMAERDRLEAERVRRESEEEDRRLNPLVSSEVRLMQLARLEEIEQRALRRLADERAMLFGQLEQTLERLSQREQSLEDERRAWEASVEAERHRRASEQFAKAVRQYESVPPRHGKNLLLELIQSGEDGLNQAVAYLDAMNARAASKIIAEFRAEEEVQLATELLERLRMLGPHRSGPGTLGPRRPGRPQENANARGNLADAR